VLKCPINLITNPNPVYRHLSHDNINTNTNNNNNSIQFFIIYVLSQQPKGQLQTQHSLDTGNYIIYKPNYRQALVENNNNNSIQFFIIYVPSQQPKVQLQSQHGLDTGVGTSHSAKQTTPTV
jgi:hypothetical protein